MRTSALAILALAGLVAGTLSPLVATASPGMQLADTPSPMFRGDARHTGRSPHAGAMTGTVRWLFDSGKRDGQGGFENSAAIGADGTVYVGGNDGIFYAFDGATGRVRWTLDTKLSFFGIFSSAAIGADGTIYFGSKRRVYALVPPAADGDQPTVRWSLDMIDMQTSPVIGPDGTVYLGTNNMPDFKGTAIVGALRAPAIGTRPQVVWDKTIDRSLAASPALANGVVYIGSFDGNMYALDAATGQERWKTRIGEPVEVSATIGDDGTVYVGANDGVFYALDGGTGAIKWTFETRKAIDGIFASPALGPDGILYFGANDGYIYALDSATGALRWEFETGLPVLSSPTVDARNVVYVGSNNGIVYALRNGRVVWQVGTEGAVLSSPVIGADGTVYVGSMDGKFYAIGP